MDFKHDIPAICLWVCSYQVQDTKIVREIQGKPLYGCRRIWSAFAELSPFGFLGNHEFQTGKILPDGLFSS